MGSALLVVGLSALVLTLPGPDTVQAQAPPSEEALDAQRLAWAVDAPGPKQPIPFSHALHAGTYEIDCLYCDVIADRFQRFTGVPAVLERTGDSPIPMKPREENMR